MDPECEQHVLVVDDDPLVSEIAASYLRREGFAVDCARDGESGLRLALTAEPDAVVLDVVLPDIDGFEVCRRLRRSTPTPVLMLSALGDEVDRVNGFQIGADDYVVKPFSPRELALRVRALLRRSALPALERSFRAGEIEVDVRSRRAHRAGADLALTCKEFDLLACFLSQPGRAFSRPELLQRVWGWSIGDTSTVTVHVRRLREKIESDPSAPRLLTTVRGVGYRFETEPS